MEEIWKDITGYEGLYQVSNLGRVKSLERIIFVQGCKKVIKQSIMRQTKNNVGYFQVNFCFKNNRKRFLVHRLVAQAFIPNPYNLPQVNHKDEDKENNFFENLEWCDNVYNNNYGSHCENISQANSKPVMCVETGEIFKSQAEAAKKLGTYATNISRCCLKKRLTVYGFHFEFAEV